MYFLLLGDRRGFVVKMNVHGRNLKYCKSQQVSQSSSIPLRGGGDNAP